MTAERIDAPSSTHRFAKTVRVVQNGFAGPVSLYIDGELFPYHTANDPILTVGVKRGDAASVTITLIADRVEVVAGDDA